MEANNIDIIETIPASRKLQADDAKTLLKGAKKLIAMKGKKTTEFDLSKSIDDDMVAAMLGPTGNMRAPTIKTGNTYLVGFNDEVFSEAFKV